MELRYNSEAPASLVPSSRVNLNFVAGIFHEFYTPLTVIKEFVSIIQSGAAGNLSREQSEYLKIVHRNAFRIENLLQDLRSYSQIKFGEKLDLKTEIIGLAPLVEEALSALKQSAQTKALSVHFPPCRTPICVLGDRKLLLRAVLHLISNAIDFTPCSGSIGIKIGVDRHGIRPDSLIVVEDNGIGIPEDELDQVFEPFHKARNSTEQVVRGLGLGLTIVRKIAEEHGGSVRLARGKGTVATLALPIHIGRNLVTV